MKVAFTVSLQLAILALSYSSQSAKAADLDHWNQIYPRPSNQGLRDVASDGTNWIAVGTAGTILVSPDGAHWAQAVITSPVTVSLNGATVAAGRWVVVGQRGTILSSDNGANWINVSPGTTTEDFQSVTYGGDRFLAVGAYGLVASSTNGVDWKVEVAPSSFQPSLAGIAYGKGVFVAGGLGTLQTSYDGIAWTQQNFQPQHDIQSVWFDGSQFIAGRIFGVVFTSNDGTNWFSPGGISATYINKFTKLGDTFYAAAGNIYSSPDLANWTFVETGAYSSTSAGGVSAAASANRRMVIVGEAGNILSSSDGTNFVQWRTGRPLPLSRVVWHKGRTIVLAASGTLALTSEDRWTWTERPFGASSYLVNEAISDGDRILVVGTYLVGTSFSNNEIRTSPDGIQWTSRALRSQGGLYAIAASTNLYVAVGKNGIVHTSPDAVSWSSNSIPGKPTLFGVTAGAGRFVAVGPLRTNYVSIDGLQWTAVTSPNNQQLNSVAWGQGHFVAVGNGGTVVTSEDGTNWASASSGTTSSFRKVIYDDGWFLAVGAGSTTISSNGIAWTVLGSAPSGGSSVSSGSGEIVLVSGNGVYHSGELRPRMSLSLSASEGGLGVASKVGQVLRLDSAPDLTIWSPLLRLTNTHGFRLMSVPTTNSSLIFRTVTEQ